MLWCISHLRSSLDHTNTLLCATHSVSAQDTSDEMHDFVDIIPTLLFSSTRDAREDRSRIVV